MLKQPVVPKRVLDALRSAEKEARRLRDEASAIGVESIGLKVGDVVRDPDTGARYAVKSCYVWIRENDGEPQVSIMGTRVYSTGRRDARSTTILTGRNFEVDKVPEPA